MSLCFSFLWPFATDFHPYSIAIKYILQSGDIPQLNFQHSISCEIPTPKQVQTNHSPPLETWQVFAW